MKTLVWIIPAVTIAITGCHKNANPPAAQAPTPEADTASTSAAPAPPTPGTEPTAPAPPSVAANSDNVVRENVNGEVNQFLTSQLRIFIQQYHRMPQSFAEFALRRIDSMPPAPEGKKWVIDAATQEVKAMPK
jgi:hypothetical protein